MVASSVNPQQQILLSTMAGPSPKATPPRSPGASSRPSTCRGAADSNGSDNTRPSSSPEGRSADGSADLGRKLKIGGTLATEATRDSASSSGEMLVVNATRSPVTASGSLSAPTQSSTTKSISASSTSKSLNSSSTPPSNVSKTPSIPKNPKDTAAYVSPGGTVGGTNAVGGASPKRRLKSMDREFNTTSFSSNFVNNGLLGIARASSNSVGGSVGGASSGHGNTSVGAKSVGGKSARSAKSVPSAAYKNAAAAASPHETIIGHEYRQNRLGSPSSSLLLNDISPITSNSQGGSGMRSSMKDIHVETGGGNSLHNSLPNIHGGNTHVIGVNSHSKGHQSPTLNHKHSLDDEEQHMFEQRLTQDELGVAIRKISHSGKAQLRYVKCVPLRPPSSSDFGEEGGVHQNVIGLSNGGGVVRNAGGKISDKGGNVNRYLDSLAGRQKIAADSISVSSKSSTGSRFLERMKSTSAGLPSGMRRLIPSSGSTEEGRAASDTLLFPNESGGMNEGDKSLRALTWGKKNAVTLSLDSFTAVRKGKTTERTIRNGSPSSRLLSIITNVRGNESLDIEAPTMLDRDKFASAFARFLGVPLAEEDENRCARAEREGRGAGGGASTRKKIRTPSLTRSKKKDHANPSAAHSEPGLTMPSPQSTPKVRNRSATNASDSLLPQLTPNSDKASDADREMMFESGFEDSSQSGTKETISSMSRKVSEEHIGRKKPTATASSTNTLSRADTMDSNALSESARKRISLDGAQIESMLEPRSTSPSTMPQSRDAVSGPSTIDASQANAGNDNDAHSHVSSLTGGVDQEIVEELHQAIIELRSELDASRAEAARAVKVAEQAIQSAENCTSSDWNSTVTHKAAEAAAQAQKKSAEAIARARMAEERLAAERKSTGFWRRQAQAAEEEAGSLKTRSAAAEVKRVVMVEELASERRRAARMFASLKAEFQAAERRQVEEVDHVQERKRALEVELEECKAELKKKTQEMKKTAAEERERSNEKPKGPNRMRPNFRRPRSSSRSRGKESPSERTSPATVQEELSLAEIALNERVTALQTELVDLRRQFELVRHTSMDEILALHRQSEEWSNQASRATLVSATETDHLREKLAAEGAMRLKLLNELQDIRGTVRVYCRPRPLQGGNKKRSTIKIPTHDILVLNEDTNPMSFKYDRVFTPGSSQHEVFSELEEPLISSLDGFNVTLMAFGQGGSGKTRTLLGDINFDSEEKDGLPELKSHGVQLQAIQQLFTIAGHRTDRYKDSFSITMVEVYNEKLFDLLAETPSAESDGKVVICETRDMRRDKRGIRESGSTGWPKGKLEIRTNIDGNTVVQGLVSVPMFSYEEAMVIWQESIANRMEQLRHLGLDPKKHGQRANVITTINITSVNIATGVGTEGKLQFVDMASSDIVIGGKVGDDSSMSSANNIVEEDGTKFANKCIDSFNDVISARCQFDRSVPYRNSTLTHLLRDSLEADTKVLLLCCISSEEEDLDTTFAALRFASSMQKVSIGKATKHIIGGKE